MRHYKEDDIDNLIASRSETKNLDFKEEFHWNNDKDIQLKIIKAILAMSNASQGGRILVGVTNSGQVKGVSEKNLKSFDQTSFNDILHKYTDPKLTAQISRPKHKDGNLVIIEVPEFDIDPIICKADGLDTEGKNILRKGAIYIRTAKATTEEVPSSDEMRELLGRALSKKGDYLLNQITRMLQGRPSQIVESTNEKYEEEIKETNEFIVEQMGNELAIHGNWEIIAHPVIYKGKLISSLDDLKQGLKNSNVILGGWSFPFSERGASELFTRRSILC